MGLFKPFPGPDVSLRYAARNTLCSHDADIARTLRPALVAQRPRWRAELLAGAGPAGRLRRRVDLLHTQRVRELDEPDRPDASGLR
jgi:hypothetical protein